MLKADNTRDADADRIALTNNGLLYLFSSLKLTLAGQTVEHVNYPGQATSLLCLASYSSTYYKGCGPTQGWFPDPIHIFNVSKQSERLTGVVDLTVRMEFSANVPANAQAYALVISDRMLKFKSDGSKMSLLF